MKAAETKTSATSQHLQAKGEGQRQPFFQSKRTGGVLDHGQPSFFTPSGSDGIQRKSFFAKRAIQPKLRIGQPGDKYEQEAEHLAEQVVRVSASAGTEDASIQRRSSADKQVIQAKPLAASITRLVHGASSQTQGSFEPGSGFEAQLSASGGGSPLPASTRAFMEPRFEADFRGVRLHTGSKAAQVNRTINAEAFARGADIYMGDGTSDVESTQGKRLLAHELTHTIQQGAVGATGGAGERLSRHGTPALMRFVGTEHRTLGDTTGSTIDLGEGIVLTWGQVLAIAGDEYGSVEELEAATATPGGKARLRAALEHDGVPGVVASKLPEPTAAQRSAQEAEFVRLAMENTAHFPDGGQALDTWGIHHTRAIETALSAGLANDPKEGNKAYLYEAFGEHFLTDSFSAGHIRTPRTEIVDWYTGIFAPRVVGQLIANLRSRIVEALVAQANPQAPNTPEFLIRSKISGQVQNSIDNLVARLGGMAALTRWVGLGIAGAISGTIHDAEGDAGVLVASDAHPASWRAFGDKKLDDKDNSITKEEAIKAVAAAKSDVDAAYRIGEAEGVTRTTAAAEPPQRVHFAFNSSNLAGPSLRATEDAAAYLLYHQDAAVELVGHTDPIGPDTANEALGFRRSKAVETALIGSGVAPTQIAARSEGERELVTRDPKSFRLNRRTEFLWHVGSKQDQAAELEFARGRAQAKARATLGPPYVTTTRFVPRPVEERGASGNIPLPDWHWGMLTAGTRAQVDAWIRAEVGTKLDAAVATSVELNDVTQGDITVRPREAVSAIVHQLLASPTATLGDLLGEVPGP